MFRAIAAAMLFLLVPPAVAGQAVSVLHIKVSLVDTEQKTLPVSRHALLISDNPASAAPRRVVTAADGTVDVRLRPGNYTVESDEPLIFQGQAIHWTQTLDIVAGRDAVLELTSDNAEVESAASVATTTLDRRRQTTRRRSRCGGRTASSRSGLRPPTRRGSLSTRKD